MSSTCYIFLPFFCIGSVKLLQNLRLLQKTFVILLLFKFLPSNAAKKLLVENEKRKVESVFFDGIRGDVQLGRFILLSFSISQQLPRLTSLYFFTFLK